MSGKQHLDAYIISGQFIFSLHSHKLCTEFLHEFLELIRRDMIVVKPKHKGRINCGELHQRLLDMVDRCKNDTDYASMPVPRSRNDLECGSVEAVVDALGGKEGP